MRRTVEEIERASKIVAEEEKRKAERRQRGWYNQRNGYKFEIKIWHKLQDSKNTLVCGSNKGSLGWIDSWALLKDGRVRLVIVRASGYLTPEERKYYAAFFEKKPANAILQIAYYRSPKKHRIYTFKSKEEILAWR